MLHNKASLHPADVTLVVERDGQLVQLSYQKLFAIGHKLWVSDEFEAASKVFEKLCEVSDRGPRAHILLAHCQAMCGDYAKCCRTLSLGLPATHFGRAGSDLHVAFVMWKCGLFQDVKAGLKTVIADHPELPTPCLLLADLLTHFGSKEEPVRLLKAAIQRDRPDGAIALIAQEELPSALERLQSTGNRRISQAARR